MPTLGQVPNGIDWMAEVTQLVFMNNPGKTEGAGGWIDLNNIISPVFNKVQALAATHTALDTKTEKDQLLLAAIHEAKRLNNPNIYGGANGANELARIIESTYYKAVALNKK